MKILHTSDWHLGHTLYNYDRTPEQRDMLAQIREIVERHKPDLFLLCGDVYHTSQPSAAVQKLFSDAITEIRNANPDMTIVVTAGNHDSGSRHEIFRTPWQSMGVHCIGTVKPDTPDDHIIEIPGKGFVVAVPYCHERNLPEGFFQTLLDIAAELNSGDLPVVMTAHTTVAGCDFSGHDHATDLMVGGIDTLDISQLGDGYDYLALGHIHHAQFVHTGKHNVRYSGTPLPVSFDENYPHSVSMVEIDAHGARPQVETINISNPHPLVTLPAEGFAEWEDAKRMLSEFPADIPAYIRLNVAAADFLPVDALAEATAAAEGKECRLCHINVRRKASAQSDREILTVQEFQAADPLDIARRYAEECDITLDDDICRLFSEVARMVNDE